ncbi:MAG: 3-mercaptopyruvate sulfurtransferase [Hyphomicrobiaceae bacterium]
MTENAPQTLQRKWLVETGWLAAHLDAPDIVVLDASWHLPGTDRDARAEYLEQRIPGAVFFDIDEISDEASDLPHMLPSPVKFSSRMRKLGIGDGLRIIVYDSAGLFSAARVWWTFRVMGHDDVAVLNGGLPKWLAEDRSIDNGPPPQRTPRHFTPRHRPAMVRDVNDMRDNIENGKFQTLDARPAARFVGKAEEPRAGLRLGHIPGSENLPAGMITGKDMTVHDIETLQELLEDAGIDLTRPVVTTCGSGVTAAILTLALAEVGHTDNALYDGSWSEWGARDDVPVATGDS